MTEKRQLWILIPARGQSKGIPRKNLRSLGGSPLIHYCIQTALKIAPRHQVFVSSEDSEILNYARQFTSVHKRPDPLARDATTLDEVAFEFAQTLAKRGASPDDILVTLQPTSPFTSTQTVLDAIKLLDDYDTVLTASEDRHLRWRCSDKNFRPLYESRVNRQGLPEDYRETGSLIACRLGQILEDKTRVGSQVGIVRLPKSESLDIDEPVDWAVAEFLLRRRKILIRADGSHRIGLGHIYRALALGYELGLHEVLIVSKGNDGVAEKVLRQSVFRHQTVKSEAEFKKIIKEFRPDITILDVLDTKKFTVQSIKSVCPFIVSFENLGPGARLCNLVINDLYSSSKLKDHRAYSGLRYSIVAPNFEILKLSNPPISSTIQKVLITFGGSDPGALTLKVLKAIAESKYRNLEILVVVGLGYSGGPIDLKDFRLKGHIYYSVKDMAEVMQQADIAFTSGGRTVTELMMCRVPTIVLCQNKRELTHTHASLKNGILNLGLGSRVKESQIIYALRYLAPSKIRRKLIGRISKAISHRSNRYVTELILNQYESFRLEKF